MVNREKQRARAAASLNVEMRFDDVPASWEPSMLCCFCGKAPWFVTSDGVVDTYRCPRCGGVVRSWCDDGGDLDAL